MISDLALTGALIGCVLLFGLFVFCIIQLFTEKR